MNCADILTGKGFIPVNRAIAQKLESIIAAAMLGYLTRWRETYKTRDELDDFGGFFAISEKIEKELFIKRTSRKKYQKLLVDTGFLKVVKRGVKGKSNCFINHYYIQDRAIVECIMDALGGVEKRPGSENDQWVVEKQPRGSRKTTNNKNLTSKNKGVIDYQLAVDTFNKTFNKTIKLTQPRISKLKAYLKDYPIEDLCIVIERFKDVKWKDDQKYGNKIWFDYLLSPGKRDELHDEMMSVKKGVEIPMTYVDHEENRRLAEAMGL